MRKPKRRFTVSVESLEGRLLMSAAPPYVEYSRWSPCLVCGNEFRVCRCEGGWTPDPSNPRAPYLVEVTFDNRTSPECINGHHGLEWIEPYMNPEEKPIMDAPKPSTEFIATIVKDDPKAQTPPPVFTHEIYMERLRRSWAKELQEANNQRQKRLAEGKEPQWVIDLEFAEFLLIHDPCPKCGLPRINNAHRNMRDAPCECGSNEGRIRSMTTPYPPTR